MISVSLSVSKNRYIKTKIDSVKDLSSLKNWYVKDNVVNGIYLYITLLDTEIVIRDIDGNRVIELSTDKGYMDRQLLISNLLLSHLHDDNYGSNQYLSRYSFRCDESFTPTSVDELKDDLVNNLYKTLYS